MSVAIAELMHVAAMTARKSMPAPAEDDSSPGFTKMM